MSQTSVLPEEIDHLLFEPLLVEDVPGHVDSFQMGIAHDGIEEFTTSGSGDSTI